MQRGVGGPQLRARLAAAPSALAPAPCPACPVLAPSGGLRRGEQGGAHGQPPPLAGVRCRLPAPPAGPLAGRSWALAAASAAPLSGQRPTGGAARHSPLGGPWAVPRGRCSGGPASGAWGLPPVPRRACPLPGPSSPGASARSPRPFPLPSPSPSGGGGAQEVDARCGGDGRRPPTPAHKKSLPACGSRHPRKGTKDVFCSIVHLPAKPPSLTGLLKISRPGRVRSDGGTRRNARRISGPDIKTAAFGKASPKSMEMG